MYFIKKTGETETTHFLNDVTPAVRTLVENYYNDTLENIFSGLTSTLQELTQSWCAFCSSTGILKVYAPLESEIVPGYMYAAWDSDRSRYGCSRTYSEMTGQYYMQYTEYDIYLSTLEWYKGTTLSGFRVAPIPFEYSATYQTYVCQDSESPRVVDYASLEPYGDYATYYEEAQDIRKWNNAHGRGRWSD